MDLSCDEHLLECLFRPRSVAVIGASDDPGKLSGRPIDFLKRFGFSGEIVPVNPRHERVQGVRSYPSLADFDGEIDLAVIALPAPAVVAELRACAAAGVPLAIVFASGFGEVGEAGLLLEAELRDVCRETGIRVLGPNCLGGIDTRSRAVPTFTSALDSDVPFTSGPVAIVSQSGAYGTFLFSAAQDAGMGIGTFVNTGNEVDVSAPELIRALLESPDVEVVLAHLEGISDPAALIEAGQVAARTGKTIVLAKAGATVEGARAAAAHTASRPTNDAVVDGVLDQLGIIRAGGMEEMIDIARMHITGREPSGRQLSVVTMSGGAGVLLTDGVIEAGLEVPVWSEGWRREVSEVIPSYGSTRNPLDITGSFLNSPEILERTLEVTLQHPNTDIIAVLLGNADRGSERVVAALQAAFERTSKPMLVVWTGGSGCPRRLLTEAGIPVYTDPARAVRALAALTKHALRPTAGKVAPEGPGPYEIEQVVREIATEPGECGVIECTEDTAFGPMISVGVDGPDALCVHALAPVDERYAQEMLVRAGLPAAPGAAPFVSRLSAYAAAPCGVRGRIPLGLDVPRRNPIRS